MGSSLSSRLSLRTLPMDPRYLGTPKSSPQVVDDLVAVAAWYFGDGGGGQKLNMPSQKEIHLDFRGLC